MKVLILVAHADKTHQATAYRIANAAEEAFKTANIEYRISYLNEEGFDRNLSDDDYLEKKAPNFNYVVDHVKGNLIQPIVRQHELGEWATNILVIGPMWFYTFPACFHSWKERVLIDLHGQGKRVSFVITNEGDEKYYSEENARIGSIEQLLLSECDAFHYSKFDVTRPLGYYNAGMGKIPNPEAEKVWLEKFKKSVIHLDQWQLWGTNNNKPPLNPETIINQ